MRPLIFGEVLFDSFEDGSTVLGGAPFNVAWHLHGFGASPLLLSRIGDDDLGKQIVNEMEQWGMDLRGLQIDSERATGTVQVTHRDNQPAYDITLDVAYDHIQADACAGLLGEASVFYHGSLASRNKVSRGTLQHILDGITAPVFLDVNLRPPHWKHELIDSMMHGARWVKLNDDEMCELTRMPADSPAALEAIARQIHGDYSLDALIVTRGSEGALVVDNDGVVITRPEPVDSIVDTVGAGDAFSSVFLLGILSGWKVQLTLDRAVRFAAAICRQRGAINKEQQFYEHYKKEWQL
jgi:fructokinase